ASDSTVTAATPWSAITSSAACSQAAALRRERSNLSTAACNMGVHGTGSTSGRQVFAGVRCGNLQGTHASTPRGAVLTTRRPATTLGRMEAIEAHREPRSDAVCASRVQVLRAQDGLTLACESFGDASGPPLIFAHGFGQPRHAWVTVARALAADGWHCL